MGIREQAMQDDLRREFRAGDLELLAAVLRAESAAADEGGGMVGAPQKSLDMQSAIGSGYPFGAEYPFGISISGTAVTVYPQIVYHGGQALETEETTVTILADGDWVVIEFDPDASTPAVVVKQWDASAGLPRDHDGLLVRGIWRFALDGEVGAEVASLERAGWAPGNLAMMAEDGT
jgi:hypothetical protein